MSHKSWIVGNIKRLEAANDIMRKALVSIEGVNMFDASKAAATALHKAERAALEGKEG